MRKTDLFPENDSPGCELREPERPIDAPYAVDIPAVPTALGALDAASRAEFWAALALSHTDGLGARSRKRLLDAFGSAFEAVRRANDWREAGLREDLIREFRSEKWREPARKEWDATRKLTGTVLLWTDSRYPALLKELPDAPIRLYCQGDMSLLGNPCVSIVGTRTCSREGIRAAQAIASGLAASGITVVSGLAIGIDKQAHLAALDLPGGTILTRGGICMRQAYSGATFSIPSCTDLTSVKQALHDMGLSEVGRISSIRNFVIINDAAYLTTERAAAQRLWYMQHLFPVVYAIALGLAYLLAFLQVQSRRRELRTMRSVGADRKTAYGSLFLEQLMLAAMGAVLGAGLCLVLGWGSRLGLGLTAAFAVLWLLGAHVALCRANSRHILKNRREVE